MGTINVKGEAVKKIVKDAMSIYINVEVIHMCFIMT